MISLWSLLAVLIATLIGAFGAVLLKKGSQKLSFNFYSLIRNHHLIKGFLLYGASLPIFLFALKGADLSILYPVVATNYIWISFLSVKFLGESMNKWKFIGIALIILGVTIIGFGS